EAEDPHRRILRFDARAGLLHRTRAGRTLHAPRHPGPRRQHPPPARGDVQSVRARARRRLAARSPAKGRAELEGTHRMIAIVDYGVANVQNVERRLQGDVSVPHTGWNEVTTSRPHPWLAGVPDGAYFYFVHSYAVHPSNRDIVVGTVDHGGSVTAAVASDGMLGLQFHPEKSGAM